VLRFQRLKRGFTLIELLVVIAILAVLVTASVIGYTSFVERAKISKDTVTLSQYNTVLEVCAAYEGHNRTMTEALAD
jgi:prepilin peptidase dependent protein D